MRLTKVRVTGFKSLTDFELDLSPFTCLIGLNGCGKSTVLQFFDFISHVLAGDVDEWFDARDWDFADVAAPSRTTIEFDLMFSDAGTWSGEYDVESRRCIREGIHTGGESRWLDGGKTNLLGVDSGISGGKTFDTTSLAYRGSITNIVRNEALPEPIRKLKEFVGHLRAFDTLAPQFLRRRDRQQRDSIGHSGEYLASFFDALSEHSRAAIVDDLAKLYPHLENVFPQSHQGGWKELVLHEAYETQSHLMSTSKHMNDGLLRTLAILVALRSEHSFLLFDEIENGINPELIEALIEKLTAASHQVLVTTHSPMILNYLDDDLARESVVFLHKGPDGGTRSKRFFEIPSMRDKLEVMGPGEVFVDTNLTALSEELNSAVSGA